MDVKGGVVDIVWRCSRVVVVAVEVGVLGRCSRCNELIGL